MKSTQETMEWSMKQRSNRVRQGENVIDAISIKKRKKAI